MNKDRRGSNSDQSKKKSGHGLEKTIYKAFVVRPKKRLNAKDLLKILKGKNSKESINQHLNSLEEKGQLVHIKSGRFKLNRGPIVVDKNREKRIHKSEDSLIGKLDMTRNGSGYVIIEGREQDVFVSDRNMNSAFNGDTVKVQIISRPGKRKPEGKISEVVKRSTTKVVGRIQVLKKYGLVEAEGLRSSIDVYVRPENLNDAKDGDFVIVEITEWGKGPKRSIWGKVEEQMNEKNASDLRMKTILINSGFELYFPAAVQKESEAISEVYTEEEISKRRDMRKVPCFTIDPLTAKDFDDALSYQELDNGNIEIGVHIADVTHYLRPGSELDKEALKRTTSVYLVDRVLPMLPEKLSNNLCSLVPDKDRFTFSAIFTFNEKYKIIDRWFGKTIIHSQRRFTYEEAQEVIETGEGDFAHEVNMLNKISAKLRKAKYKNGAISFDAPELQFKLDEDGFPIEVYYKTRKEAHLLIEDFMLLANKEVATFIQNKGKAQEIPFVYRIHDLPNTDKLEDFKAFALELGFKMDISNPDAVARSFNELTKKAKEDETLKLLEPLAIRCMSKAAYSSENIGHYGLAFDNYSHFTSPIRRYADVLVHRLLEKNLEKTHRTDKTVLEEKCLHISSKERKAMEAERASKKYKQVEYVMDRVGEVFDARISGMIDKGIFVEIIESRTEGLISFGKMAESFNLDDSKMKITGNRSGKVLKLGDSLRVKLLSVDLDKAQVDFEIVSD